MATRFTSHDLVLAEENRESICIAGDEILTVHYIWNLQSLSSILFTYLYDFSHILDADILSISKKKNVTVLLKSNKSFEWGSRYSPVSILCLVVKIFECSLVSELTSKL